METKIIQIALGVGVIYGLGEDGKLYYFNTSIKDWSPYNA